jgi:hypothetical protein
MSYGTSVTVLQPVADEAAGKLRAALAALPTD